MSGRVPGERMSWPWLEHIPGGVTVMRVRVADSPARGDIDHDPEEWEYIGYRGVRHVAFGDTEADMRFELDDHYREALTMSHRARTIENVTLPDGFKFQVVRDGSDRAAVVVGDFAAARIVAAGEDLVEAAESLRWAVEGNGHAVRD